MFNHYAKTLKDFSIRGSRVVLKKLEVGFQVFFDNDGKVEKFNYVNYPNALAVYTGIENGLKAKGEK